MLCEHFVPAEIAATPTHAAACLSVFTDRQLLPGRPREFRCSRRGPPATAGAAQGTSWSTPTRWPKRAAPGPLTHPADRRLPGRRADGPTWRACGAGAGHGGAGEKCDGRRARPGAEDAAAGHQQPATAQFPALDTTLETAVAARCRPIACWSPKAASRAAPTSGMRAPGFTPFWSARPSCGPMTRTPHWRRCSEPDGRRAVWGFRYRRLATPGCRRLARCGFMAIALAGRQWTPSAPRCQSIRPADPFRGAWCPAPRPCVLILWDRSLPWHAPARPRPGVLGAAPAPASACRPQHPQGARRRRWASRLAAPAGSSSRLGAQGVLLLNTR